MDDSSFAVLVVDESDVVRDVLREMLELLGYTVATAAKCDCLIRPLLAGPPAVLIVDLRLTAACPGWHIIRALRGSPATRRTPIVAMRADRPPTAELAAALAAMRIPLLMKPIWMDDLTGAIEEAEAQGIS